MYALIGVYMYIYIYTVKFHSAICHALLYIDSSYPSTRWAQKPPEIAGGSAPFTETLVSAHVIQRPDDSRLVDLDAPL